jgi:hypothetical protein
MEIHDYYTLEAIVNERAVRNENGGDIKTRTWLKQRMKKKHEKVGLHFSLPAAQWQQLHSLSCLCSCHSNSLPSRQVPSSTTISGTTNGGQGRDPALTIGKSSPNKPSDQLG